MFCQGQNALARGLAEGRSWRRRMDPPVNEVLRQYMTLRKMIKQYGAAAAKGKLRGLGKFSGM